MDLLLFVILVLVIGYMVYTYKEYTSMYLDKKVKVDEPEQETTEIETPESFVNSFLTHKGINPRSADE